MTHMRWLKRPHWARSYGLHTKCGPLRRWVAGARNKDANKRKREAPTPCAMLRKRTKIKRKREEKRERKRERRDSEKGKSVCHLSEDSVEDHRLTCRDIPVWHAATQRTPGSNCCFCCKRCSHLLFCPGPSVRHATCSSVPSMSQQVAMSFVIQRKTLPVSSATLQERRQPTFFVSVRPHDPPHV